MEVYEELMLSIKRICTEKLEIPLNLTELPKDGGMYAEIGPCMEKRYIRSRFTNISVPILFMYKGTGDPECIRVLGKVCRYMRNRRSIPDGESYRVKLVKVQSEPHKTGNTESGHVVYSCIINFDIFERRTL